MTKSRKILIVLMAVIVIALSTVFFPNDGTDEFYKDENLVTLFPPIEKLTNDMVPQTYQAVVNDQISINAKVTVPDNIDFGTFKAVRMQIPEPEKVRDIFLGSEAALEIWEDEDEDIRNYHYTADDGSRISIISYGDSLGYINYMSGDKDGYNMRDSSISEFCRYYINIVAGDPHFVYTDQLDRFFTKTEIEGVDRSAAVSLAEEKLDALGIEYGNKPEVYVIDSEGVEALEKYKSQRYNHDYDYEFKPEDEAYFIIFNNGYQGMPICYESWSNSKSATSYDAHPVYAVVTRKGLVELQAAGFDVIEEKTGTEKLYNADVLERVLLVRFENKTVNYQYEFTEMRLEYIGINNYDKFGYYEFVPCWSCRYTSDGFFSGGTVYINAITGEIIDTGNIEKIV